MKSGDGAVQLWTRDYIKKEQILKKISKKRRIHLNLAHGGLWLRNTGKCGYLKNISELKRKGNSILHYIDAERHATESFFEQMIYLLDRGSTLDVALESAM